MTEPQGRYGSVKSTFRDYWHSYGGLHALVGSPYLHFSLVATIVLFPAWVNRDWWTNVLQVLPSIIGFSIGGYAIWLGFGDEKFKALIAGGDDKNAVSPYMEVSATFSHFVVVQLAAILAALAGTALNVDGNQYAGLRFFAELIGANWNDIADVLRIAGGFIGYLLFMYALVTALAAVFAIFRVALWFDEYRRIAALKIESPPEGKAPSPHVSEDGA
jgi:hypothetical protein